MVRFGIQLGVDTPSAPEELAALADCVEALPFDSLWIGDHVVIPSRVDQEAHERGVGGAKRFADRSTAPTSEVMTTLAFLAALTRRVRLGTAVLVLPLRNPVLSAKMLSSIDVLSGGRLDVGVGVGWIAEEFEVLGAEPFELRGAVTDRYLDVMSALWSPEPYRPLDSGGMQVSMHPKPVQRPRPPVWIGGNGLPALRRAARHGDGWLPLFQQPADIVEKRRLLAELCSQAARDPAAVRVAAGYRLAWADGALDDAPLSGTAAKMRRDVERLAQAGCDEVHVILARPQQSAAQLASDLERFADQVISPLGTLG